VFRSCNKIILILVQKVYLYLFNISCHPGPFFESICNAMVALPRPDDHNGIEDVARIGLRERHIFMVHPFSSEKVEKPLSSYNPPKLEKLVVDSRHLSQQRSGQ
jgi:hypothetical protein